VKTLYIVRHAKSSWDNPDLDDFERPLNDRGKRDAPRMGKRLKERETHPDLILSSPARRAYSTAKRIAKILEYNKEAIKTEKKLYHASEDGILSILHTLPDNVDIVMLFGHNPGLTDFVNAFMSEGTKIGNLPTCGMVAFQVKTEHWSDISWGQGKMLFYDYPKSKED
jgi:phosphohistidine phosphatase